MKGHSYRRSRGAAVVMAMLVVALAVALVSGAFQRQSIMARQIENDAAFAQAQRLMDGAVDWVRVILREDARTSNVDHGGEAWAVSLEQTRLDNDNAEPAWVAGGIEDAQGRFNLRNLSGAGGLVPIEVAVLGCAVNGIGEASHADFGITGAKNEGMIFAHGKPLRKVPQNKLVDELFAEIDKSLATGDIETDERKAAEAAGRGIVGA